MSFEGFRKRRRCIIQKLDFENCIITNFKTSARGRKKLRARITREFQDFTDIPEQSCEQPVTICGQSVRASSPVLLRKQCRSTGSPALTKKIKSTHPDEEFLGHSTIEKVSSTPGSPVFKTFKKRKKANVSVGLDRTTNPDVFSQRSSSSGSMSSFQIEDFSQESKQSVKISSVESPVLKADTSSSYSGDAYTSKCRYNPTSECVNVVGKYESPKPVRRNYKKNSLLGRLQNLQRKQASEKLLWQHQNRKNSANSLTLSIVTFWKEEFNYYLKCQSADLETTFLVVDTRWVPNIKDVKEGSVLQLNPPWQRISVKGGSLKTVLLGIICLNILDETKQPVLPEKMFEIVPADRFETDRNMFIDSLFSSCGSGLLV